MAVRPVDAEKPLDTDAVHLLLKDARMLPQRWVMLLNAGGDEGDWLRDMLLLRLWIVALLEGVLVTARLRLVGEQVNGARGPLIIRQIGICSISVVAEKDSLVVFSAEVHAPVDCLSIAFILVDQRFDDWLHRLHSIDLF